MTFFKIYRGSCQIDVLYIVVLFLERIFLLFLHLTKEKIKKRVRNDSSGMILTCKISLGFLCLLSSSLPCPHHTHTRTHTHFWVFPFRHQHSGLSHLKIEALAVHVPLQPLPPLFPPRTSLGAGPSAATGHCPLAEASHAGLSPPRLPPAPAWRPAPSSLCTLPCHCPSPWDRLPLPYTVACLQAPLDIPPTLTLHTARAIPPTQATRAPWSLSAPHLSLPKSCSVISGQCPFLSRLRLAGWASFSWASRCSSLSSRLPACLIQPLLTSSSSPPALP